MTRALPIALSVALLLAPALSPSDFYVNVGTQILIAAIFALSLNLLVGYGGLISLGHAAYLGVSAYLTIWLVTRAGLSHPLAAVAAVVLTTAMSVVFGLLSLRATGLGFLMITLALGQILWGATSRAGRRPSAGTCGWSAWWPSWPPASGERSPGSCTRTTTSSSARTSWR